MTIQSIRKGKNRMLSGSAKISSVISSGRWLTYSGVACVGALSLLSIAMICPIANDGANAADDASLTDNQQTMAQMRVQPMVSVSLQDAVEFDVTPSTEGAFNAGTASLTVSTNSSAGYSVYMKTGNGEATLANGKGNTVAAVSGQKTPNNFAKNTWGYALGKDLNTNTASYQAVPTDISSSIMDVDATTTGVGATDTYTLAFGAKIGTDLPAGEYSNSVVVSVIANPEDLTLNNITSMQEMTPEICTNTPDATDTDYVETKLVDERDQQQYYVAKLKDGNCWMTQNLALDLSTTKKLTADDTDLGNNGTATEWTPKTSTITNFDYSTDNSNYQTANSLAKSWTFGKVVRNNPTGTNNSGNCSSMSSGNITGCSYFTNVSSMTEGFAATTTSAVSGNTYDGHYLVGNLYDWNAATANSASTSSAGDAPNSICPKGWKLPTSGYNSSSKPANKDDSFVALLNAYGYSAVGSDWTNTSLPITTSSQRLDYKPLSFVRSGYVYSGSLYDAG